MSYRNPQIIQDRSGEILAKGISQATSSIAKGIQTLGAKREAERKRKIAEDKQFRKDSMKIARQKAADSSTTNKNLAKLSGNIDGLKYTLKYYGDISGEAKVRGVQGTSTSEDENTITYAQGEMDKLNSGIELTLGYAGTSNIENPLEAGNGQYIKEDENGSIAANRAFHFGLKSAEGFSIEYPKKIVDGKVQQYVKATDSDGNSYEKTWDDYTASLREGGYVVTFPSVQVELMEEQSEALYDKKGNFLNNLTMEQDEKTIMENGFENKKDFQDKSKVSAVNDKGEEIIENRQYLNKLSIQQARERLTDTTFSKVTYAAATNKQALSRALIDLNIYDSVGPIGADQWLAEDMTDEMKKEAIERSTNKTWETTRIKKDSEGRYYRVTSSYSPESPKSSGGSKESKADEANRLLVDVSKTLDSSETPMTPEQFPVVFEELYPNPQEYKGNEVTGRKYVDGGFRLITKVKKEASLKPVGDAELKAAIGTMPDINGTWDSLTEEEKRKVRETAEGKALADSLRTSGEEQFEEVLSPVFKYTNQNHMVDFMDLTITKNSKVTDYGYKQSAINISNFYKEANKPKTK